MPGMFQNEQLLKKTPLPTWLVMIACSLLFLSFQPWSPYHIDYHTLDLNINQTFGLFFKQTKFEEITNHLKSMLGLETSGKLQLYRLFTCFLLPHPGRVTYAYFAVDLVGLHSCTWLIITANRSRWQKIIWMQCYVMMTLCLVSAYLDPVGFIAPR